MNYHDIAQRSEASQDHAELEQLLTLVGDIQPQYVLEIGVHLGRSMKVWDEAFKPTWLVGLEKDTCYDYTNVPGRVITGVDSGDPKTVWDIYQQLNGHKLDFLFVDGDHTYNAVVKDFLLYSGMVRVGGIIAFHDIKVSDNPTCQVDQFWAELQRQYPTNRFVEFTSPGGTGTGVFFVKE